MVLPSTMTVPPPENLLINGTFAPFHTSRPRRTTSTMLARYLRGDAGLTTELPNNLGVARKESAHTPVCVGGVTSQVLRRGIRTNS